MSIEVHFPQIMGVLNITPESRYGGRYPNLEAVLNHAETMVCDGVAILDVGGESTRPGAQAVSSEEELERVMPVIEALVSRFSVPISVDTRKTVVMRAAIQAGVSMINDVNALRAEGALEIIAKSKVNVCVMHSQGEPATMQDNPTYQNVLEEVKSFLEERVACCEKAGIARDRIIIDPGFGFGKNLKHNLTLLKNLEKFHKFKLPILVGLSRKMMIEAALGLSVEERLPASLSLAVLAALKGAAIIRTHDVKPTIEAVKMAMLVQF